MNKDEALKLARELWGDLDEALRALAIANRVMPRPTVDARADEARKVTLNLQKRREIRRRRFKGVAK